MSARIVPVTVGPPAHSLAGKTFVHHTSRPLNLCEPAATRTVWSPAHRSAGFSPEALQSIGPNSFRAGANTAHYSATTLMKTAALDLAPAGIRVDGVSPGVVDTLGIHTRYGGLPGWLSGIRKFLEDALGFGDVWITTRREIAAWGHAHHGEFER